jgi:DNA (cytosine-5)-methyltransferase 1
VALRSGSEAIDHSQPGRLIGDRFKPNTRRKVEAGHHVYAGAPFIAELRGGGSTHRSLAGPLSTITAGGNHHLWVHGDAPDVRDRFARMLSVDERKVAMGFPEDYKLIATAEEWREQQKQLASLVGMAVTPNASRDLGCMISELITGQDIDPYLLAA